MEGLTVINREIGRLLAKHARELDSALMYEEAIAQQKAAMSCLGPLEAETMLEHELDGETDWIAEFERELNDCRSTIDALEERIMELKVNAANLIAFEERQDSIGPDLSWCD